RPGEAEVARRLHGQAHDVGRGKELALVEGACEVERRGAADDRVVDVEERGDAGRGRWGGASGAGRVLAGRPGGQVRARAGRRRHASTLGGRARGSSYAGGVSTPDA